MWINQARESYIRGVWERSINSTQGSSLNPAVNVCVNAEEIHMFEVVSIHLN